MNERRYNDDTQSEFFFAKFFKWCVAFGTSVASHIVTDSKAMGVGIELLTGAAD